MIRSIAVTTDFSKVSREPFAAAAAIARKFGAELSVIHVAESPETFMAWDIVEESPARAERRKKELEGRLEDLVSSESSFQGLRVRPRVVLGESGDAVVKLQKRAGIDLIVMASHGHTGIEHFLLGSFTARVLQLAACPVLVFRARGAGGTSAIERFEPRRILVPHDFSHPSLAAQEIARSWTREYGARARLVFVVEDLQRLHGSRQEEAESFEEHYQRLRREGDERLRELVRKGWQGIETDFAVRSGHPAMELLGEAESFGADLIIMASRGLSVLERLDLGSVAERVVHGARVPVLVIPRKPEAEESEGGRSHPATGS